jgi:hypothetical protein
MIKVFELDSASDTDNLDTDPTSIVVCDQLPSAKVISLCLQNSVHHVVQKSNFESAAEIKLASSMILSPEYFHKFPLSVIFGVDKPTEKSEGSLAEISYRMAAAAEKPTVLGLIETYVEKHATPKSISADVQTVADELITNSIYNAPFVNMGNTRSGAERNTNDIAVDPTKKPHIFGGRNKEKLVIGCTDFYGRLNVKKLLERIQYCYENSPGDLLNYGPGGAGIGSFMIFELSMGFYVGVDPGKSTTVACAFPLNMSARKRHSTPKNLHFI